MKIKSLLMAFIVIFFCQTSQAQRQIGGSSLTRVVPQLDQLTVRSTDTNFWVRGPISRVDRTAYQYKVYDGQTGEELISTPKGHFTWGLFRWPEDVQSVRVHRLRWVYSASGTLVYIARGAVVIHR